MTAEELFELFGKKELLENYGDEETVKSKTHLDLAKTRNYKHGVFYHATGGYGEMGLGEGLYLGKDKKALNNFYNCDGGKIEKYQGTPNFIDLTISEDFEAFDLMAKKKFPYRKNNEYLKLLTLEMGYDGIRYYDPYTTGEEFVLFNTQKVTLIRLRKQIRKRNFSILSL